MSTHVVDRRSGQQAAIPTIMMQAVDWLEKWKLNVMFVAGLAGTVGIVYWFAFGDRGHQHSTVELIISAIMFGVCAFFAFPLGITRLADNFWPEKWRKDRRKSSG